MIPNIFHFVFGMSPDFGGKPFSLVHYLAIKSAIEVNKPEKVLFHYQYEPSGEWWDKIKPYLTLNKIEAPEEIFGNKLYHVAHKADVIRLQMLQEYGGVYLDCDVICIKPFHDLYTHEFVIGQQYKPKYVFYNSWLLRIATAIRRMNRKAFREAEVEGLCNAVMMSQPHSRFIDLWIDSYRTFRSKGKGDIYWGEHSVFIPLALAEKNPTLLHITNARTFHFPLYNGLGLKYLFEKTAAFPEAYAHHVWESHSWNDYLQHLTPESIKTQDTTYNLIARRFL